jgi:hypothetical protein
MRPGDLVIIRRGVNELSSRCDSVGIVLSAKNLGGTDDPGFQINSRIRVLTVDGVIWRMRFELEKVN